MGTALIVVDMQSAFVAGPDAVPAAAVLVPRVTALLARARTAGILVVHLQNDGPAGAADEPDTPGWRLALKVRTGPRELIIRKTVDDGFEGTELGSILAESHVSPNGRSATRSPFRLVLPTYQSSMTRPSSALRRAASMTSRAETASRASTGTGASSRSAAAIAA